MKRRGIWFSIKVGLVFSLILTIIPIWTLVYAEEKAVSTFDELKLAIENASSGETILIQKDIEFKTYIDIEGKSLLLRSNNSSIKTLRRGINDRGLGMTYQFFTIGETASVTLENISINGSPKESNNRIDAALINNLGDLVLGNGTTLSDNHIYPPAYRGGGAIYNTGTLTMLDGAVIKNCSHGYGGNAVGNEGVFNMKGGHIERSEGGGFGAVYNMSTYKKNPEFYMSGGRIDGTVGEMNEGNRGNGVYNDGDDITIRIGGNSEIYPVALDLSQKNYVQVESKLNKTIVVYVGRSARKGKIIAKGKGYTLTEDDKDKFKLASGSIRLDTLQNALILDLPDPVIERMELDKETLPYKYGSLQITITGKDLPDGLLVNAFEGTTRTDIKGYTSGSSTSNTARLYFPENTEKIPKTYIIKVSTDDGITWSPIEKTVIVDIQPSLADESKNTFIIKPDVITTDTPILITAVGDRQSEEGEIEADQRYIPSSCGPENTPFRYIDNNYVAEIPPLSEGEHTIIVYYSLEEYKDGTWVKSYQSDRKSKSIQVQTAPRITTIYADKKEVTYTGESIQVTMDGEYLSDNILVKAFNNNKSTDIQGYSQGNVSTQTVTLTFPENTKRTPKSYTIKASFDNGITWNPIEENVTVTVKPLLADADKNTFKLKPDNITTDTLVLVEAVGDHQEEQGIVDGDERYIPILCGSENTIFQYEQNSYITELSLLRQGEQEISVTYALERFDGTSWIDTKVRDIKKKNIYVVSIPKISDIDVNKDKLSYTGGTIEVYVNGEYLEDGMLIKAFDQGQPTTIQGYTKGTDTISITELTFPKNAKRVSQIYTLMLSRDNGKTWQNIEKEVTVDAQPVFANEENNTLGIPFGKITPESDIVIVANGDRQNEVGVVIGDERYIPIICNQSINKFQYTAGKYQMSLTPLPKGLHIIKVTYALQRYDGTAWIDTMIRDTKSKAIQVEEEVFSSSVLTLDKAELTLHIDESMQLHYELKSNDEKMTVRWESMNTKIADVDANGMVYAKDSGTTIIRISTSDGKQIAECEIHVLNKVKETTNQDVKNNVIVQTGRIPHTDICFFLFCCFNLIVLYGYGRWKHFSKNEAN